MRDKAFLLTSRAQALRSNCTEPESALWRQLRSSQLGTPFRRQVPVAGRFIADFLAPAARVIVEVDGGYHAERRGADARRDRKLARAGYRVLRLEAELVMRNMPEALARIRAVLADALAEKAGR